MLCATPKNVRDLTGIVFGRLRVLRFSGLNHRRKATWICHCSCGNDHEVIGSDLTRGRVQSCGCLRREKTGDRFRNEGRSDLIKVNSAEYRAYYDMMRRCYSPHRKDFARYGGRGIKVCERWRVGDGQQSGLACFLDDMGPKPAKSLSIDRIDNESGYSPSNCRWATWKTQRGNRSGR